MESRRIFKSRRTVMIDGVCGGLADYFKLDVTIVRLIFAASVLFGGTGILVYVICSLVIPREPDFVDHTKNHYDDREN